MDLTSLQWRHQDFVTGGSEVWVYRGSRVRSPPVPVVLSVYQRDSLLDGLAMYLSFDTKKFHDNESTHILAYIIFGRTPIGGRFLPFPPGGATASLCYLALCKSRCIFVCGRLWLSRNGSRERQRSTPSVSIIGYQSEMDMGWVHPWVGWVRSLC